MKNNQKYIGKIYNTYEVISAVSEKVSNRYRTVFECKCKICDNICSIRLDSLTRNPNRICNSDKCKIIRLNNLKSKKRNKISILRKILLKIKDSCIICHSKENLELHHLDSWHWDEENRLNVKNSEMLCKNCHDLFHTRYGIKENTEEQFKEFTQIYRLS